MRLEHTLGEGNYAAFYAQLRKLEEPLTRKDALDLAAIILERGYTVQALKALLEHSPPLEELMLPDNTWLAVFGQQLTAEAARFGGPYLSLLLELGASPNCQPETDVSPLEAAITAGTTSSVRRLLREPALDASMTPALLRLWAQAEHDEKARTGWKPAARRLTGQRMPPAGPVPLVEGLTVVHAAQAHSWALVSRICQSREQGKISIEEGLTVLGCMECEEWVPIPQLEWETTLQVLDALLSACPGLLGRKWVRQRLVLYALCAPEESPVLLRWLERMPCRQIALWSEPQINEQWGGADGLLAQWRRLDGRAAAVLDRNRPMPINQPNWLHVIQNSGQEVLDDLIRSCPVRGKPRPGKLSPLAWDVLRWCSAKVVEEQFQPGGLLAQEDPYVLWARVQAEQEETPLPRQNLQVVMAYGKAEKDPYLL